MINNVNRNNIISINNYRYNHRYIVGVNESSIISLYQCYDSCLVLGVQIGVCTCTQPCGSFAVPYRMVSVGCGLPSSVNDRYRHRECIGRVMYQ